MSDLKAREKEGYFFVAMILAVFIFGMCCFVKPEHEKSALENRTLVRFQNFTLKNFLSGQYQKNFESAISDQFLLSERIRKMYRNMEQNLPVFGVDKIICANHYLEVPGGKGENRRAFFNCEDYLVGYPLNIGEVEKTKILEHIENYNYVNSKVDTYYYYVENFFAFDFESNESDEYKKMLEDNLVGERGIRFFTFGGWDEYKRLFYKTDHHWNYLGSYEGYLDIVDMMSIKKVLKPLGTHTNHDLYYGTSAKLVQNYTSKEEFSFYNFDFPKHTVYINGEVGKYGHYDDYMTGNYSSDLLNYYSFVYGNDIGEVVFDYGEPNQGNLLIISDSYGDPLKEILAANYNKTYSVDLRYYKKQTEKDFAIDDYIAEHDIDTVLFIFSPTFLTKDDRNQGLEK